MSDNRTDGDIEQDDNIGDFVSAVTYWYSERILDVIIYCVYLYMMVLDELLELGEKSVGLNPDDAQRQVLLKSESVANKIKYALESDEFNKNLQELTF